MIVDELRKSILNYAFKGKLTFQHEEEKVKIFPRVYNSDDKKIKESINNMDLPSNWNVGKFGKYITLISGQDLTSDRYYSKQKDNSIPYLTGASNLSNGELIINRYTDTPTSVASKGNILLTCKGTIGETLILEETKVHIARQFMAIISNEMNTKYVLYFLKNSIIELNRNAKSIIPGIDREFVLNLDMPIPPVEEQQRIVNKIEELFNKLDELKPIEDELNKLKLEFPNDMKKSILKDAFDGKYSVLSFNEWATDKLINACNEICTGNSISENIKKTKYTNLKDGYNYIGTKDLNFDHSFEYENGIKIPFEEQNFKYAYADDILLCIEGGSAGKKIGILSEKVCYGNKLCKFSSSKLNSKFLYYYLQSPQFVKNFYDNISGIIGGVSINKIKTIEISFPPIEEQQRIVDKLELLLPLCDDIEKLVGES